MHHPHIHCIVPAGGLSFDKIRWINSRKKFFIPVKVLSRKFRGKFLAYLQKAYYNKKLKFVGQIKDLEESHIFQCFIYKLKQKEWVVYCKPPFKSTEYVLQYLGRYTHKVAISNNRIVFNGNGYVTYKWRDYKDNNKEKYMTVSSEEFIRRFLLHVLPDKFVKIRHYGILANRNRKTKLKLCKRLTGIRNNRIAIPNKKLSIEEFILKLTGKDITKCPCYGEGKMIRKGKIQPSICSPPKK